MEIIVAILVLLAVFAVVAFTLPDNPAPATSDAPGAGGPRELPRDTDVK